MKMKERIEIMEIQIFFIRIKIRFIISENNKFFKYMNINLKKIFFLIFKLELISLFFK